MFININKCYRNISLVVAHRDGNKQLVVRKAIHYLIRLQGSLRKRHDYIKANYACETIRNYPSTWVFAMTTWSTRLANNTMWKRNSVHETRCWFYFNFFELYWKYATDEIVQFLFRIGTQRDLCNVKGKTMARLLRLQVSKVPFRFLIIVQNCLKITK